MEGVFLCERGFDFLKLLQQCGNVSSVRRINLGLKIFKLDFTLILNSFIQNNF